MGKYKNDQGSMAGGNLLILLTKRASAVTSESPLDTVLLCILGWRPLAQRGLAEDGGCFRWASGKLRGVGERVRDRVEVKVSVVSGPRPITSMRETSRAAPQLIGQRVCPPMMPLGERGRGKLICYLISAAVISFTSHCGQ